MTRKMGGNALALTILLFSVVSAAAQTYTQMQWGINKSVTPYAFGANINGTWRNLGTVSATGDWNILLDDTVLVATNYAGVDPTGATFSDAGFLLWLADMKAKRRRGYIPNGYYRFQNQLAIDTAGWLPYEFGIECAGYYTVILDVTAVTVSPQAIFKQSGGSVAVPSDQFYGSIKKCTVSANTRNVTSGIGRIGFAIGNPDNSDAMNGNYFDMIVSNSDNINSDPVAVQLNKNYASEFKFVIAGGGYKHITTQGTVSATNGSTAVTGSGTNFSDVGLTTGDFIQIGADWFGVASVASNTSLTLAANYTGATGSGKTYQTRGSLVGTALRLENVSFSTFPRGSYGQADKNLVISSSAVTPFGGFNIGNVFFNPDLEEGNYNVTIDSASATQNIFLGGIYVYNKGAINVTAGNNNTMFNALFSVHYSQPLNDIMAQTGLTVFNGNSQVGIGTQARNLYSGSKAFQDAIDSAGNTYHSNYNANSNDNYNVSSGGCYVYFVNSVETNRLCGSAQTTAIATTFNNGINVGVSGSIMGSVAFRNATSGSITLEPTTGALGTVTATLPANTGTIAETNLAQTWTAIQTFDALIKFKSYTVATLPTCNAGAEGSMAYVTDATAPTYDGALTGGGAVKVPVFCNGAAWRSH